MSESSEALRTARKRLAAYLPPPWRLERASMLGVLPPGLASSADQAWGLIGPGSRRARLAVSRRARLSASDVALYAALSDLSGGSGRGGSPTEAEDEELALLVSAPWISRPMREQMVGAGINYADDTGNLFLALRQSPVLLRAEGALTDPSPRRQSETRLRGDQALAVIRYLVDTPPPYTQAELATATKVSPGYVSKVVSVLEDADLITRERGAVVEVDWAELLRERAAQASELLGPGKYEPMVARRGLRVTLGDLGRLAEGPDGPVGWVTGSAAAQRLSPVSSVSQLLVRTDQVREVRRRLGLLPAGSAGLAGTPDVLLLTQNFERSVVGAAVLDDVPVVAPSQLVLDCLGGNGRLPAEGEEVLRWMQSDESRWRAPTVRPDLGWPPTPPAPLELRRAPESRTGAWTADAVQALLRRLDGHPAQVAAIVAAASSPERTVSREDVYRFGDYDENRSLRGFTRPVNRVADVLVRAGLLAEEAPAALTPVYSDGSRATGFEVPREFTDLVATVASSSRADRPGPVPGDTETGAATGAGSRS